MACGHNGLIGKPARSPVGVVSHPEQGRVSTQTKPTRANLVPEVVRKQRTATPTSAQVKTCFITNIRNYNTGQ